MGLLKTILWEDTALHIDNDFCKNNLEILIVIITSSILNSKVTLHLVI
jgi:hypothetical protein